MSERMFLIQNAHRNLQRKPDNTTRTIDFDTYTLSHKQTWAGFNNNDKTYSDSIKSEITENGKEGCALELTYKAATWYAGRDIYVNTKGMGNK